MFTQEQNEICETLRERGYDVWFACYGTRIIVWDGTTQHGFSSWSEVRQFEIDTR